MYVEIYLSDGRIVRTDVESLCGYRAKGIEEVQKYLFGKIEKTGLIHINEDGNRRVINGDYIVEIKIIPDKWLEDIGTGTTEIDFSKIFEIFGNRISDEKEE
ncbi:hypothetical protein [Aedoeadaptatus coxii]|uniref:hypothetical protein n=1 Tax=Aedoeadaptatus coxii TaxID=755172 RepID=UPI002AD3C63D|nr:hypothetical protein [Peptoniphilus coxii]